MFVVKEKLKHLVDMFGVTKMSSLEFKEGYYCDSIRHLVCYPYSIEGLHKMAETLGIKRCWFHNSPNHAHYDIPKKRIAEITAKCMLVDGKTILSIIKGTI